MTDFVYILSASHSGSTLLTMLLASHPDVASVGEASAVLSRGEGDTGLCSCGRPVVDGCRFWHEVGQGLAARGVDWRSPTFDTQFLLPESRLGSRLLRAEYRGPAFELVRDVLLGCLPSWWFRHERTMQTNVALVEEVTALCGARVFVDSSKEPHRLKHLLRSDALKVHVVHLVRDGRGVAASYVKRNKWPICKAADEWRRSIVSEEHILRRLPADRIASVSYEDLCEDPEGTVASLFAFMGVDPSHSISDWGAVEQHILGNRMRMGGTSEVRKDEKWRALLSPEDLSTFDCLAGPLNRSYGY